MRMAAVVISLCAVVVCSACGGGDNANNANLNAPVTNMNTSAPAANGNVGVMGGDVAPPSAGNANGGATGNANGGPAGNANRP